MGVKQALEVLGKALEIANSRNSFAISDTALINTAFGTLNKYVSEHEVTEDEPDEIKPKVEKKETKKSK